MQKWFKYIVDYIFPPSKSENNINSLNIDWLKKNCKSSHKCEFPYIESIYSYKDTNIKEIIWLTKYKKNKKAAMLIAESLIEKISNSDIIIPIPISKERMKERGFNQCELILEQLIKINPKLSFDLDILYRKENISKQTFKNRSERIKDARNIFGVHENDLDKNVQIILIDDVCTTGSTVKSARDELLAYGFKNISAITFAH